VKARSATWAAPGRVNLIGEHTDYNEGWVLPVALEQSCRATVTLADRAGFASTQGDLGRVYAEGVVAAFGAEGYDVPPLKIEVSSEVPIGAGLSSSAALECSIALAVDDLLGLTLSRTTLVRIAQRAENDFVGVPSGILDPSASLLCEPGHALLLDCRNGETEPVRFAPHAHGLSLFVIDTRVRHDLADGQYTRRHEECAAAAAALGLRSLRDARVPNLDRLTDPVLRARARHVVTENARVHEVVAALRTGAWARVGRAFIESHLSMRDDFEVSCPELDLAVEVAVRAGAIGARMTGGGFGGSAIALVPTGLELAAVVEKAFVDRGYTRPVVRTVRAGGSARRLGSAG